MVFQSTRGPYTADAAGAILSGMAPDGGLFVDPSLETRPFDTALCLSLDPLGMQSMILRHLLGDLGDMDALVRRGYEGKFDSPELTPLVSVGEDYMLELFRGPTAAFKDVALSMLPQLLKAAKERLGVSGRTVVLTATSGDTGKAALEGFAGVEGTHIFVFYPHGGVSAVQRAQMVTQSGKNVTVCAVRGNFDDCQSAVKRAFAALAENGELRARSIGLTSANSINIGRLAPQPLYYFLAYASLLRAEKIRYGEKVDYVVPTGNFGDILAGWMAGRMGLPVGRLVCASNANRVLTDFFRTGVYDRRRAFYRTASPSMDILVSSNLERLLYYASGADTDAVRAEMAELEKTGRYAPPPAVMERIRSGFEAFCCDDEEGAKTISSVWKETGYLCDPHTAVAAYAARLWKQTRQSDAPVVILSTASPYKFPSAVLDALGAEPDGDEFARMDELCRLSGVPVPKALSGLRDREVLHSDVIDASEIIPYILKKLTEVC